MTQAIHAYINKTNLYVEYTAILRKVVGSSSRDNPEIVGGLEFTVLQRNFKEWH